VKSYNALPSREALFIDLSNKQGLNQDRFQESKQIISNLEVDSKTDPVWLLEKTEKFCQDRAVYNAIRTSISILDDKTGQLSKGSIPKLLQDALAVSFDSSIGHDFIADAMKRFALYHQVETKIPFRINLLNQITKGGVSNKTLNILLAPTGVGKTIFLCDFAAANLAAGYNVLYITLEMAEEKIAERIDANLLDLNIDEIPKIPEQLYTDKIQSLAQATKGKLIIKEYPTTQAGASHFRYLLNELKLKKNFVPQVIYVDYINICMSTRIKQGANVNSYSYIKSIAEELRGLGVEFNLPIWTATQTNRQGYGSSDLALDDTSDSIGLPMTADLFLALIASEELEQIGQIMVKQLKNRYSDVAKNRRFVVGLDKMKMRIYNVENKAQETITKDDAPIMDGSSMGWGDLPKDTFTGFK
jgi:archaellum biogenesis ATPase FlaH